MPKILRNDVAVARLHVLIESGEIDRDREWSFTDDDAAALLGDPADWNFYGSHFLGVDEDYAAETRERFLYPFARRVGDRVLVHPQALDDAALAAGGDGSAEITEAASEAAARVRESLESAGDGGGAGEQDGTTPPPPPVPQPHGPNIGQQSVERGRILHRSVVGGVAVEVCAGDYAERAVTVDKSREIDIENRRVPITFSSETEVNRGGYVEILSHAPGAVRLGRLKNRAPVLVDHETKDHVGVVEEAEISADRLGLSWTRFGRSARSMDIFWDLVDDIRCHVSVGYRIWDAVDITLPDGRRGVLVTDWEPLEISIAPIPWDDSQRVGVKRSFTPPRAAQAETVNVPLVTIKEEKNMSEATLDREQVLNAERDRVRKINEFGAEYGQPELARRAVEQGVEFTDFRYQVLEEVGKARKVTQEEIREEAKIGMSEKEIRDFSVHRALNAMLNKDWTKAGLERACSVEAEKRSVRDGRSEGHGGAHIPYDVFAAVGRRAINVADGSGQNASGAKLVGTDHLDSEFIEMLRPTSVLAGRGIRVLDGLVGNVEIPRRDTGATFYVINNETTGVTESHPTFGVVSASPTTIAGKVSMTRRMLAQSSPSCEAETRSDLIIGLGEKIDEIGLIANAPVPNLYGLLYTTGVNAVECGVNGAAPDWNDVVAMQTKLALKNARRGSLGYVFSPKVKGFMQTTEKASGTAQFIMGEGDTIAGLPAGITTQMPDNLVYGGSGAVCSAMICGNFSDAILFVWGGMELKLDEIGMADKGGLIIRIFQDAFFGVRHPESFTIVKSAIC